MIPYVNSNKDTIDLKYMRYFFIIHDESPGYRELFFAPEVLSVKPSQSSEDGSRGPQGERHQPPE